MRVIDLGASVTPGAAVGLLLKAGNMSDVPTCHMVYVPRATEKRGRRTDCLTRSKKNPSQRHLGINSCKKEQNGGV